MPAIQNPGCPCSADHVSQMIRSLLKKPAVMNGRPASEQPAIRNVQKATGISLRKPPIRNMLCSSSSALMITPAPRNRRALKNACVTKWNMAACQAPTPSARNM